MIVPINIIYVCIRNFIGFNLLVNVNIKLSGADLTLSLPVKSMDLYPKKIIHFHF